MSTRLSRWNTIEVAETTKVMVKQQGRSHVVRIKGLPTLRLKKGLELPPVDSLKTITITKRGRRLWTNLNYAVEQEHLYPSNKAVGLDLGVTDRIALSTGERFSRRHKPNDKIGKAQQRLSRCRKGSRLWKQRRAILANVQHRERVRNRNECHRLTTDFVKRYGLIAIEDLKIEDMTASAKGTVEEPGKNVRQKSGLNRSINEQTWGIIRHQFTYKAEWAGRRLVAVDPRHTSQKCSRCGAVDATHRQGKEYDCSSCGLSADADVNAALNILYRGLDKAQAAGNWVADECDPDRHQELRKNRESLVRFAAVA